MQGLPKTGGGGSAGPASVPQGNPGPQGSPPPQASPDDPTAKGPQSKTDDTTAGDDNPQTTPKSRTKKPKTGTDADSDMQTCQSLKDEATDCCTNPARCGGGGMVGPTYGAQPGGQAGVRSTCGADGNANSAVGNSYLNGANACISKYSNCESTCNDLASNYESDQDTQSDLKSKASACHDLSVAGRDRRATEPAVYQCRRQQYELRHEFDGSEPGLGSPTGGSSGYPNGNNQMPPSNDPYNCATNPTSLACRNCSLNPDSPYCKSLADATNSPRPQMGFQSTGHASTPDKRFDTGDPMAGVKREFERGEGSGRDAKNKINTIPNANGGRMLGAGETRPATLGPPTRRLPSPGLSGFEDIDKGLRSGGYSSTAAAGQTANGPGGPLNGRQPSGANMHMDLKRYLPGAQFDPARRAGGIGFSSLGINGPSYDMFEHVSARYQEKCKLGGIFDCR